MTLTSKDFPRIITKQSVVIVHGGKHNTIKSDHPNYDKLIVAFREKQWDDVPGLVSPEKAVETLSDGRMRVEDGQVYLIDSDGGEFTVSRSLNDNIMLHIEQGLDMQPLVTFGLNLQRNSSSRSINQLFDWIQNTNLTITDDGCFVAYKGIKADFKDSSSGDFDNSPGCVVEMPRNQVDDDPTRTCSHGLHVATFDYASTFSVITVSVKVNPADVVAVPTDYARTKMRVCKYTVLEEIERPVTTPVYDTSSYLPCSDDDDSDDNWDDGDDDGDDY
ncbi:hypothetical protein LCGC14_0547080 [marine sediment metagenome]|uniref:Uncharacterized protein n=1 Tax=marine sediment metagenome TaxID=412755 RepID=A0A0F9UCC5_9ZZZZ